MATAGGSAGLLLGGYVADLGGIQLAGKTAGTLSLFAVPRYLALQRRRGLGTLGRSSQ
jgi:hypothetical protein